jgi:hypothetical protein
MSAGEVNDPFPHPELQNQTLCSPSQPLLMATRLSSDVPSPRPRVHLAGPGLRALRPFRRVEGAAAVMLRFCPALISRSVMRSKGECEP